MGNTRIGLLGIVAVALIVTAIILVVALIVLGREELDETKDDGANTADTPTEMAAVADLPECDWAVVTRVIDGDTVTVEIDGAEDRVRYIGVDTPETMDDEPFAADAMAFNARLVEGKDVCLERDVNNRDEFNRLLRYVWLPDGTLVNEELAREGFAWAVRFGEDVKYLQERILPAQREAILDRRAVWLLVPEEPPGCFVEGEDECNCTDFDRHQEAQYFHEVFDEADVNGLVRGDGGLACVSLPDRLEVDGSN